MSNVSDPTRRDVLGRAALGAIAGGLVASNRTSAQTSKRVDENSKLVVGLAGCGGMGRYNMKDFMRSPEVRIAAVCDVDANRMAEAAKEAGGEGVEQIKDYRALLDRKDIDVVICAPPDHWHGLITVRACQAGKDVYVEKPLSHNIKEGRAMVDAARRYGRVVQVGTQQRSGSHFQEAAEIVRSGKLGKITSCRTWNYGNDYPNGFGFRRDCAPPAYVDYDMWLGPAPKRRFNPNRFHYQFRYFYDYAGGMLTDWGVHLMDIVLWAMQVRHPRSVVAMGGKFGLKDNRDTPDTIDVVYDFVDFTLTYSYRHCNGRYVNKRTYGITFHGTQGTLAVDRRGYELYPETKREGDKDVPLTEHVMKGGSDQHWPHVQNFIECVKTREKPIADIEEIHYSTTVPNLGNIAYRVGRQIYWDGIKEQIIGDEEANRLTGRVMRKPYTL
ncbi:MAG: Gfo/Idh/MocA family oxidoreductase [Phycisphaerae bacterium]|nr:Gfo/Idh/MocA family oxidoreductase [Phycisphaerae bacterium]